MSKVKHLVNRLSIIKTKIKYILRSLYFLFSHPDHFKYFFRWLKSFNNGHSAFSDELPWLTYEAVEWLENYLTREKTVFEYGSGGSTLFMVKRAGKVVSVEHDREWFQWVKKKLEAERYSNYDYFLFMPQKYNRKGKHNIQSFRSTEPIYKDQWFQKYVKSIDHFPDVFFDLVIVDGRARTSCARQAIKKIKPGGFLMLDNSEREIYIPVFNDLKNCKRIDFYGLGNYNFYPWQTSIWEIN